MRWNLNSIYDSFECDNFKNDMKCLEDKICSTDSWTKENFQTEDDAGEKIKYFIAFKNEAGDLINKLGEYSYLTLTADTKNTSANQNFNKVLTLEQRTLSLENRFQIWAAKVNDINNIISDNEDLKDYQNYIEGLLNDARHMPSTEEIILLSKMKETGSHAWESLHRIIISNHKKQTESESEFYDSIADAVTYAYNSIKGEQITESELKHYDSPLQMAAAGYKIKEETLRTMFRVVEKYVQVIQKGIKHKAELLGYNGALPFNDVLVPLGKSQKIYTFDEVKTIILDCLKDYGNGLYSIAQRAFNENWIDSEPRQNKRPGGFSADVHSIKESRILFNFTGHSNNISQLAHEIGHAYHYDCLNTQPSINSNGSLIIMESAAIFSENFLQRRVLKISPHDEKVSILNELLMRDVRLILDIYAYFNFETKVFEMRKEKVLSANELCYLLKSSFIKAYGDSVEKDTINERMWMTLPQLFYSNRPYYMVSYAFGLLFAKGLYAKYIDDKDKFVKDFEHFLTISGKYSVEDAALQMGIDISSEKFWMASLKIVEEEVNAFIEVSRSL